MDTSLKLYLKLDLINQDENGNYIPDLSADQQKATIHGDPKLTADNLFGNSLAFSEEDFLEVSDPFGNSNDFTISVWVRPDALNDGKYHAIIGKQGDGDAYRKPGIWLAPNHNGLHYDSYDNNGQRFHQLLKDFFQTESTWVQITWVKKDTTYSIYRDGVLFSTGPAPQTFYRADTSYWIGKVDNFWEGNIAHVRIYDRAISQEEVEWDRDEDLTAMAAFKRVHPISFKLYDNFQQGVLYILSSPTGQLLKVDVQNDSNNTINFQAPSNQTASTDNHHFSLHFRPGTLSEESYQNIQLTGELANQGWILGKTKFNDGSAVLYLLKNGAFSLNTNEKLTFSIINIGADVKGGARGSRVELHYREDPTPTDIDNLPSRHRTQHINIVNHLGQPNLPAHFGPAGPNTVSNVGNQATNLHFHLTNLLPLEDPAFPEKAQLHFKSPGGVNQLYTKVIISFDTRTTAQAGQGQREWALCDTDNADGISIDIPGWTLESKETEGIAPEWIFRPTADITLSAGQVQAININSIHSNAPSGHARIVMRYENVPGFWDGQLVAMVEKTPISIKNKKVGIATADPQQALVIKGTLNDGKQASSQLTYGGNLALESNAPQIDFIDTDANHDDWALHVNSGHMYFIQQPWNHDRLVLHRNGYVGIGTSSPQRLLQVGNAAGADVRGMIRFEQSSTNPSTHRTWDIGLGNAADFSNRDFFGFRDVTGNRTVMVLGSNGNVGIGTNAPGQRLVLEGTHNTGKQAGHRLSYGGTLAIKGNAPQIDFLDTDANHKQWAIHVNSGRMYFIQEPWEFKRLVLNESGNVGVNTDTPGQQLVVEGTHNSGKHSGNRMSYGGNFAIKSNAPQIDFIDTDANHKQWAIHVNSGRMYFIQEPWQHSILTLTESARVGVGTDTSEGKLQIVNTNQDANGNTLVLGPMNQSNLRLGYHSTYSWIQSHGGRPLHINPLGNNVGIHNSNPVMALDIGGSLRVSERIRIDASDGQYWEIYPEKWDKPDKDLFFHFSANNSGWASGWLEPWGSGWKNHSDASIKVRVKPVKNILKRVVQLQPKNYHFKGEGKDQPKHLGFIAQDVEEVFPELVTEKYDLKALGYSDFGVLAIGAIKEQQEIIDKLQKQLTALEKKVNQLSKS